MLVLVHATTTDIYIYNTIFMNILVWAMLFGNWQVTTLSLDAQRILNNPLTNDISKPMSISIVHHMCMGCLRYSQIVWQPGQMCSLPRSSCAMQRSSSHPPLERLDKMGWVRAVTQTPVDWSLCTKKTFLDDYHHRLLLSKQYHGMTEGVNTAHSVCPETGICYQ